MLRRTLELIKCKLKRSSLTDMHYVSGLLALLLGMPHLMDVVRSPSLLGLIQTFLVLALVVSSAYAEKPSNLGTFYVLATLGVWQAVFIYYLPENTGYSPIFLLAPWALFRSARNSKDSTKQTVCFAVLTALGSYLSPLMWRIAEFPFGYGLKRISGPDAIFVLLTHWLIIVVAVLAGVYLSGREKGREREKLRIREEERLSLSVEVHDILAHSLTLIRMQASAGLYDESQARNSLSTIQKVSGEGIEKVRTLINSLQGQDLGSAISPEEIVQRFCGAGMNISAEIDETVDLSPPTRIAIQRILIEVLTNASKHQKNASIDVYIKRGSTITADIVSIGKITHSAPGNGIGLKSIHERCASLGGEFSFKVDGNRAIAHATIPAE